MYWLIFSCVNVSLFCWKNDLVKTAWAHVVFVSGPGGGALPRAVLWLRGSEDDPRQQAPSPSPACGSHRQNLSSHQVGIPLWFSWPGLGEWASCPSLGVGRGPCVGASTTHRPGDWSSAWGPPFLSGQRWCPYRSLFWVVSSPLFPAMIIGLSLFLLCLLTFPSLTFQNRVVNKGLQAKSRLSPVFVNKMFLEPSYTHLFVYYLWLLSGYTWWSWILVVETIWASKPKIFTIWTLAKMFPGP